MNQALIREALKGLASGNVHRGNGKGRRTATDRPRSPATVKRYRSALSGVFEYGREHHDLPENPCRGIKLKGAEVARVRFLTSEELPRLLATCRQSSWDRLYLLVLMAITTGARQGELLRLTWADLDITSRRAYVRRTKNGDPRVLPLTGEVVDLLKALPRPLDGAALIFHGIRPDHPFEFRPYWNKAIKAAGIENFRFHDLRHTCASYLAQNGASLIQIADVLGHRQLEVTKRYSHLCIHHKQALVDQVLGGIK